jgi:hypothetical protein
VAVRRWRLPIAATAVAASLVGAPPASAQEERTAGSVPNPITVPATLPDTPPDFIVGASEAINTANESPTVAEVRDRYGNVEAIPTVKPGQWEISYTSDGQPVALIVVDGTEPRVLDAWTGAQVLWPMARGYSGQFGHVLNAPYVWIPLAAIFLLGLLDFRRLRRIAHLDLLVLLSFGISQIYFNEGEIGVSVPLAYPPLIYLFARMLWIGFKKEGPGLRPSVPIVWIAVATVFLCGFRVAVNIADSGVIDVGYAGVIGAQRIEEGEQLYGEQAFPEENRQGDTYGPANYLAYVPFELALPWSGDWDELPSAHAAAIFFDLACIVGLFFLGGRLRPGLAGRHLGIVLAFAWAAYPYTDLVLQSSSNDALLAALVIWALVAFSSLAWRAALLALAMSVKFTPLALVPLFATGEQGLAGRLGSWRASRPARLRVAYFGTVFFITAALLLAYPALEPGLASFWDRTLASQLGRSSPFSIWGQVGGLGAVQTVLTLAVAAFAASLALVPHQRTRVQVTALSAAVMIGVSLTLDHWFYLYITWFFGLVMAGIAPRPVVPGRNSPTTAAPDHPPTTMPSAPGSAGRVHA